MTRPLALFATVALVSLAAVASYAEQRTLAGVISERNSATAASAAAAFAAAYPDASIQLRTPRQMERMEDVQLRTFIANADVVLVAGVFGDDAVRLGRVIDEARRFDSIFAVSSSRDLLRRSRDGDGRPLAEEEMRGDSAGDSDWQVANRYWQARGADNLTNLFARLLYPQEAAGIPPPKPMAPVRLAERRGPRGAPTIAVIDYETGDQAGNVDLHEALCDALTDVGLACQSVYADWGGPSAHALEQLASQDLAGIVLLQDFAIGGSEQTRAQAALAQLAVPVLKGVRLNELEESAWRSGTDGLPTKSVYYRVAMPELSGAGQPLVLAVGAPPRRDPISGIEIRVTTPVALEVDAAARRMRGWVTLQEVSAQDKRVAIIYYNHPPGRHNIGADNLDVPASLFEILTRLKREGFVLDDVPDSAQALLDQIQARAVNLPENDAALATLAKDAFTLPLAQYNDWFNGLAPLTRAEMVGGPLAALEIRVREALEQQQPDRAEQVLDDTLHDVRFVIEGAPAQLHPRAEALVDQLRDAYLAVITGQEGWENVGSLSRALMKQGIEGLRGWQQPPGEVMTYAGEFVFPGLRFGNVLIAPQPPRGWEVNEEVLHANMSVPPTHQYLAFYEWLRTQFQPHAIIHLGRHSTYEFLPGKRVGLASTDYSRLVAGDTPGLYPYIVDGVGEGLQAKRRGLAVIVDHLTPPLAATPFYDELLGLRQLVESYEATDPSPAGEAARTRGLARIKEQVVELGIVEALVAELEAEHGGGERMDFETIPAELLVHEVGHFLTELQEDFMPLGLHVFGRRWSEEAVDTMLTSMEAPDARDVLVASPDREMEALLRGLEGRFVLPGKGNDPLRSPDALPTGRNFYGLDASLIPNVVAWDIGASMALSAPQSDGDGQAVVLWASDTVRDGGVMMAFGLRLLGVKPVWNGRGILGGLERLPLQPGHPRRDVTFVASGLFRDLYGEQLKWLDKAVLLALDGASRTILLEHPSLRGALEEALAPLGELRSPGGERLSDNAIAATWVADMLARQDLSPGDGRVASLRLFAPAPGRYGAGINRLAERSGAWESRIELGDSYIARMGHAYGVDVDGQARQQALRNRLSTMGESYLGRASNLYGLVDNNDAFDYLGGLNLAVESVRGAAARGFVVDVSDPERPTTAPLASAIMQELRARQLNPHWIQSLMAHGYAGARTMNSAFFENLWGWEVTDPELFPDSVWEDAKAIYIDDRYDIDVDEFLDGDRQQPVKANIVAIMLVAAYRGYWEASAETVNALASDFARTVADAGLPGSGHTRPDHPMLDWISEMLPTELAEELAQVRDLARGEVTPAVPPPQMLRELSPPPVLAEERSPANPWLLMLLLIPIGIGVLYERSVRA